MRVCPAGPKAELALFGIAGLGLEAEWGAEGDIKVSVDTGPRQTIAGLEVDLNGC